MTCADLRFESQTFVSLQDRSLVSPLCVHLCARVESDGLQRGLNACDQNVVFGEEASRHDIAKESARLQADVAVFLQGHPPHQCCTQALSYLHDISVLLCASDVTSLEIRI